MIPWFVLILFIIFANIVQKCTVSFYYKKRMITIDLLKFFLFVYLFCFRAFRSSTVGGDLIEYETLFNYVGEWSWKEIFSVNSGYEYGWLIFNRLLYIVEDNFQIVLIVVSLISTTSIFWFSSRYSKNFWLTIFIYVAIGFWGTSLNNERQALAISILLFSLYFAEKRKFIFFLTLILLATSIHTTSVVFIIVYFLYNIKYEKKFLLYALFVMFFCYFTAESILNFVINHLPMYKGKYEINSSYSGQGYGYFIMLILLCIASIFLYSTNLDKKQDVFMLMLLVATILQVFSLRMSYFQRLVKIFSISMIIVIPQMLLKVEKGLSRIIANFVVIVVLLLFYMNGVINDTISLVPYSSSFEINVINILMISFVIMIANHFNQMKIFESKLKY